MLDGVSIHFITILIYLKTVLLAALRMLVIVIFIVGIVIDTHIGYEPADLTVHPPPPKRSRVGSFFSHRCLVPPKFFPQRKSGFCRRYSH